MLRCAGLIVAVSTAIACGTSQPSETTTVTTTTTARERDVHSFAEPDEVRVTDVVLDLRADFQSRMLSGRATLRLHRSGDASRVVLDTRDLAVEQVRDAAGASLKFSLGAPQGVLGQPLIVELPPGVETITVTYRTSPDAAALQWLQPSQTAGGKHQYLFSQGQAILTRTWIPTQDSPGIRQTYSARVTVPRELKAIMSAEQLTPDGVEGPDGRAFEFRMAQPIPPYLIAIAVGDITFKELGPRTGVYAEPSVLDTAANEFADLEQMVSAADMLLGPYKWGRYDVLVLPPSFPFGGMENPRLTFATPTVLAGDRSLVSLIAHELAHSWSGNLVTNATWNDFWLNEGFTTYVENRLMEVLYGVERARMLDVLGRRDLDAEIRRLGASSPDTALHLDLKGRDPDEGTSSIAYEKGAAFLRVLETTVGRTRFDAFLRGYFDRNAFQSMTTSQFAADLQEHLLKGDLELEKKLQLDEWLYKPALPANAVIPRSDVLDRVDRQAAAFANGAPASSLTAATKWSTQEWQHFLGELPERMTPAQLTDLDRAFRLTDRRNSEVLFLWLRIAIRHQHQPAMPALERFLTSQGRRKFLQPLYEELMKTDWGKPVAQRIYTRARPLYHPVATTTLDRIVTR